MAVCGVISVWHHQIAHHYLLFIIKEWWCGWRAFCVNNSQRRGPPFQVSLQYLFVIIWRPIIGGFWIEPNFFSEITASKWWHIAASNVYFIKYKYLCVWMNIWYDLGRRVPIAHSIQVGSFPFFQSHVDKTNLLPLSNYKPLIYGQEKDIYGDNKFVINLSANRLLLFRVLFFFFIEKWFIQSYLELKYWPLKAGEQHSQGKTSHLFDYDCTDR